MNWSTVRSILSDHEQVSSGLIREEARWKNNNAGGLCCTDLHVPGKAGAAGGTSVPSVGTPSVCRVYSAA